MGKLELCDLTSMVTCEVLDDRWCTIHSVKSESTKSKYQQGFGCHQIRLQKHPLLYRPEKNPCVPVLRRD